jgi:hypothetical protein
MENKIEVIQLKRNRGKTHQLILESIESGNTIVCCNEMQKRNIIRRVEIDFPNDSIPEPFTFNDFLEKKYRGRRDIKGFLIDNLDLLFEVMTPIPILAVTLR